jgi:hypothetical protein
LPWAILDPDGLTLSDTLQITSAAGSDLFVSTFHSDIEGATLLPLPGGTPITEDGTVQKVATIALNGGFAGQNFNVQFQSDIDAVPEPASVLLLGTLLVGLAATVRRKQSLR